MLLLALISRLLLGVQAKHTDYYPPCRKSPIFQALSTSAASSSPKDTQEFVVFGGKGMAWVGDKGKKGKKGNKGKKGQRKRQTVEILGDTWTFNTDEGNWSEPQLLPSGDIVDEPLQRWKSISTVINSGREMVVFGGCKASGTHGVINDLWVFKLEKKKKKQGLNQGSWRQIGTQKTPPARRAHIVEANSTHLIVHGGKMEAANYVEGVSQRDKPHDRTLKDIWALPLSALQDSTQGKAQWSKGADFPALARWGSTGTMLTAPDGREILAVFGGRHLYNGFETHTTDSRAYKYEAELWFYDTAANTWELKRPQGPSPPARDHHVAARIGNDLYVFAGRGKELRTHAALFGDLWSYSLKADRWTQHFWASESPSNRYMPGAAQFLHDGIAKLAVFGGESFPANHPASTKQSTMNDLWLYNPRPGGGWEQLSADDCSKDRTSNHKAPVNSVRALMLAGAADNVGSMQTWALGCAVALLTSCIVYLLRGRTPHGTQTQYQLLGG